MFRLSIVLSVMLSLITPMVRMPERFNDSFGRNHSILHFLPEVVEEVEEVAEVEEPELMFIGDSRFVGMEAVNTLQYGFYCRVGKGYKWYADNLDDIESYIKDDTMIVFGLGVNDLYNIKKYKGLADSEHFENMYFLSVNPVNEELEAKYGYKVSNSDIIKFNEEMESVFGERYIDSYSYLVDNGFETVDGLHYSKSTYKAIYEFILGFFEISY